MLMLVFPASYAQDKPGQTASSTIEAPATASVKIPPLPWLGVKVMHPDSATRAQLPSLPNGIGFLVSSLDEGGPALTAGIQPMDVIWKLDDQLLANEAQLNVLLRLKKSGQKVTLSLFRQGQPMIVPIILSSVPPNLRVLSPPLMDTAVLPGTPGMPMRIVNVAERSARLETSDGKAELRENGDCYMVKITNAKNAVIFEGSLGSHGDLTDIPDTWKIRIGALRRALENALNGRAMDMVRQPRPRVVLPSQPSADAVNRPSEH